MGLIRSFCSRFRPFGPLFLVRLFWFLSRLLFPCRVLLRLFWFPCRALFLLRLLWFPCRLAFLLQPKNSQDRAISAPRRLELAVRFSSLPLAVSASPTVEGEDHSSLADYDVSLFSASQLFERVNLPEALPQYTTHQRAEQEVVFQALSVNIEPFPDIDIALSFFLCYLDIVGLHLVILIKRRRRRRISLLLFLLRLWLKEKIIPPCQTMMSPCIPSQLFERVNLPETLPQYTSHKKEEEGYQNSNIDNCSGLP